MGTSQSTGKGVVLSAVGTVHGGDRVEMFRDLDECVRYARAWANIPTQLARIRAMAHPMRPECVRRRRKFWEDLRNDAQFRVNLGRVFPDGGAERDFWIQERETVNNIFGCG